MFGILHIDNASFFKSIFNQIAIEQGYTYFHCSNAKDALAVLKEQPVDLIITGTYIEDQSILSVIDQLNRALRTPVPIVVFSSNHDAETRNLLYEKGIVGFYEKNTSLEKLMNAIERIREQKILAGRARELEICVITNDKLNGDRLMKLYADRGYTHVKLHEINAISQLPTQYTVFIIDLEGHYHFISDAVYTLRNQNPEAIILCLLEYNNYDLIHDILLSGADDYILKPFQEKLFFAEFLSNVRNRDLLDQVKRQNQELRVLAIHDGLTQMFNHSFLIDKLQELNNQKSSYSVCMLDLDYFKKVNDTYGHQVGDIVLGKVAHIIKKCMGVHMIAGRYGGEEFLIIGIQKTAADMRTVAENIRIQVEAYPFDQNDLKVTISGGISESGPGKEIDDALTEADLRLYEAKAGGRNRITG